MKLMTLLSAFLNTQVKKNINYAVHKSDVKRLGNVLKGAHHPSN